MAAKAQNNGTVLLVCVAYTATDGTGQRYRWAMMTNWLNVLKEAVRKNFQCHRLIWRVADSDILIRTSSESQSSGRAHFAS